MTDFKIGTDTELQQLINPRSMSPPQLRLLRGIAQHLTEKKRGRFLQNTFEKTVPRPSNEEFIKATSEQLEALE